VIDRGTVGGYRRREEVIVVDRRKLIIKEAIRSETE